MSRKYIPGDLFVLSDGHNTLVIDTDEDGWPIKVKSLEPDPQLGKIGWFQEGDDWVIFQLDMYSKLANN